MTKQDLINEQKQFFSNVEAWFLGEMAKWSKQHNMHIEDYGILKMWVIGSINEEVHEPYSHHRDKELDGKYDDAIKHLSALLEGLDEFDFGYQALLYNDEHKIIS